jgi:hypothetical protein
MGGTTTSRDSTVSSKVRTAAVACTIAVAAALTPLPVAHAEPFSTVAARTSGLGGTAGVGLAAISPDCYPVGAVDCPATGAAINSNAKTPNLFQNALWWFGAPNPNPPQQTTVFQFYPLALIPGFIRPLFGWFANINFEACIAGLTLRIGPYGTISGLYSRGCA